MKLFEPGTIGKLGIKNRIVMAAMGNRLIEPDGRFSQRGIEFYTARAKGGTGLIITCGVRPRQVEQLPITPPFVDKLIADTRIYAGRLNELVENVHDYGARIAIQVTAGGGRNIDTEILRALGAVAPSPLPAYADPSITARELTVKEIERLVQAFQFIAEVVRSAGIDAIEINAHAGYLCDEFMTLLWNKRADRYGGDLESRLRFLMEIIQNIRKGAGRDFPIIVKYGLTHYLEDGREISEGLEIARRLEAAGVEALHIDAGCYETIYWLIPPTTQPPGCLVDLAEKVKKVVNIPVISVGKLGYPALAESALQDGKADFVALGRALLADPEWPNKVRQGRLEDICPCLGDNNGCRRRIHEGKFISCAVNPACGMERELVISPAHERKSVLVVGGGPAGMEAAIVAALRGHKVILMEKGSALGGNLVPASVPHFKQDYRRLIDYLSSQIKRLGVEVKLAMEATPELVQEMKPEVVFIATGGTPIIPEITGIGRENVVTAVDALLGKKEIGESVVIIGGGTIGCELALHLAQSGKRITVVEMLDRAADDMYSVNRTHLLKLLSVANVRILTGTTVSQITKKSITTGDKRGNKNRFRIDTIVLACGLTPNDRLLQDLKKSMLEVYAIGDCVEPRNVLYAIKEGFRLARLI
jgi:2-enoate reductase